MGTLKKITKIWTYSLISGAILIGGSSLFFLNTSILSESLNILSSCKFDPTISPKNKALIDETITTVADDGLFLLLGKESHLEQCLENNGKDKHEFKKFLDYIIKEKTT